MVTVICEKTGIEFEAATKRTKNHPQIMAWIGEAYKDGWYQQCLDTIKHGREQGWTTLEQFASALQEAERETKATNDAAYDRRAEAERAAKEAKRQRHITNNLLSSRGYHWSDIGFAGQEIDNSIMGYLPDHEWQLFSPDSRAVSVKEAMLELAFYEDAKFAHEWLAERGIAEEVPAIEAKRHEEAAKAEQTQTVEYTDEQIEYQQEAIPHFIEAGMTPEVAEREAQRLSLPHSPWEDHVSLSEPEKLPDGRHATLVINGDLRYGVLVADEWFGIDEMLEEYPDFPLRKQLKLYRERNNRNAR